MGIMFCGVIGLQTAIPSLTYYSSAYSMEMYLIGLQVSELFGSTIIIVFDALHLDKAAYMAVLLCFPIIICILFFSLDRSAFIDHDNDVSVHHGGDIEGDSSTGTNGIKDTTALTSSSINSQGPDNTTSESIGSEMLSKTDMWAAFKEICCRYMPTFLLSSVFNTLYLSSINRPLQSSSLSYGGKTIDTIFIAGDETNLAFGLVTAAVGLSILTPLGKIISSMNPLVLVVPTLIMTISVIIALMGLLSGVFPPMPIWAYYIVHLSISMVITFFETYYPLFIGADKTLTKKYAEFQLQICMNFEDTFLLIAAIFSVMWFSPHVYSECEVNYGASYDGVTCDYFLSN